MDLIVKAKRLPRVGETILGEDFKMAPGGKGANQAVALSRLGVETSMVSRVGRDNMGEALIKNLEENGVDVSHVKMDETYTGTALIIVDEQGRNMIAIARGADMKVSKEDVDDALDAIRKSDYILMQLEVPVETVAYAARVAHENGVKVMLNAAPAMKLPKDIFPMVDILVVNEVEAAMLSGTRVRSIESAAKAGRKLLRLGVGSVVVTLGKLGALLVQKGKKPLRVRGVKVKAVDATGAGDAFCAGLVKSLIEGEPLEEAVRVANYAAALSITRVGAQEALPTLNELREFMERH